MLMPAEMIAALDFSPYSDKVWDRHEIRVGSAIFNERKGVHPCTRD